MKTPQALIVEDVFDLAAIFAQALVAAGYKVTHVEDGHAALAHLDNFTPDLLLLDIHLPYLSGDKLLHLVRQDARFSRTKIIIVTADSRRGGELREEADLVLIKPVSYRQLRDLSSRLTAVMDNIHAKPIPKATPSDENGLNQNQTFL